MRSLTPIVAVNYRGPMPRASIMALCLLGVLAPSTAYAYLDPGTGSAVIQMVVAGVLGALFVMKMYWRKLLELIGMRTVEDPDTDPRPSDDEQE